MIFETMVFEVKIDKKVSGQEDWEDSKRLRIEPGVFFITGRRQGKNESEVIYVGINDNNIRQDILNTFDELRNLYDCDIQSVSYRYMFDNLERGLLYLNLIEKFNPRFSFLREIYERIKEYTREEIIEQTFESEYYEELKKIYGERYVITELMPFYTFNFQEAYNKVPDESGIYLIYNKNNELLYVGQSVNLRLRLSVHKSGSTNTYDVSHNFDKFRYILCPQSDLNDVEVYIINRYHPSLNVKSVYTYQTSRYDLKYNKDVAKYGSVENMFRMEFAQEKVNASGISYDIKRINDYINNYDKRW